MIAKVEAFHGDIIKFAGDAVIVCWRPLPSELQVRRAPG